MPQCFCWWSTSRRLSDALMFIVVEHLTGARLRPLFLFVSASWRWGNAREKHRERKGCAGQN
eukprot:1146203-Pelagomonas_calceolata.AAC.4